MKNIVNGLMLAVAVLVLPACGCCKKKCSDHATKRVSGVETALELENDMK